MELTLEILLKMQPHYSQWSHENETPSNGTSPLAHYWEVPPSPMYIPEGEDHVMGEECLAQDPQCNRSMTSPKFLIVIVRFFIQWKPA